MKRSLLRKMLAMTVIVSMLMAMFGFNMMAVAESDSWYDLDVDNEAIVNGAIWTKSTADYSTGTGIFYSFVQMQKNGIQRGYNSDNRPQQFDEKASANFNRSVELSLVPIEVIDNVQYREFLLDINQTASNPYLSLDKFQVWLTDNPYITGYDLETYSFDEGEATKVYDLDGDGETWLKMDYRISSGSGRDNYRVYIPQENFAGVEGQYVVIFAEHGRNFPANNGFEEWGVRLADDVVVEMYDICGYKFDADTFDADDDAYTGIEGWTIYLYDEVLVDGVDPADGEYVRVATTDEDGRYCFEGLEDGTYYIYEEIREGWLQIDAPADGYYEVTLPGGQTDPEAADPLYYNFVNAELFDIFGMKIDADSEEGIAGWQIYLQRMIRDDEDNWIVDDDYDVLTAVTADDEDDDFELGEYAFTGLRAGTYLLSEELVDGWIQISPDNEVNYDEDLGFYYLVTVPNGQTVNYNFVNAPVYNIAGTKFLLDIEGTALSGWEITLEKLMLDDDEGWVVDPTFTPQTATTDDDGEYSFTGLRAGRYRVSETLKSGWQNISALSYDIDLPDGDDFAPGDTYSQDFINGPDYVCYDDTVWAYGGNLATANNTIRHAGNNWGWTNEIEDGTYKFYLYAGAGRNILANGTKVGTVTVVYEDGSVVVTYAIDEEFEDVYTLTEAHLWIGEEELPKDNRGRFTSAPGQLTFRPEIADDGLTAIYTLDDVEGTVWVAAHGVVERCEIHPDYDGPDI